MPARWAALVSLGLSRGGHKRYQRVADGLLHRVFGGTIEREAVNHGAEDHTSTHEVTDRVAHVLVIPAEGRPLWLCPHSYCPLVRNQA
jgi:hypothetical protein